MFGKRTLGVISRENAPSKRHHYHSLLLSLDDSQTIHLGYTYVKNAPKNKVFRGVLLFYLSLLHCFLDLLCYCFGGLLCFLNCSLGFLFN
jgi:hypothetical protein